MAESLVKSLEARRYIMGLSRQELADRVHKEPGTVAKQLSGNGANMQLTTLCEYAEALGGAIVFRTAAELADYSEAAVAELKGRLAELEQEREALLEQVKSLQAEVARRSERIEKLRATIAKKDELCERKDALIEQLSSKLLKMLG